MRVAGITVWLGGFRATSRRDENEEEDGEEDGDSEDDNEGSVDELWVSW